MHSMYTLWSFIVLLWTEKIACRFKITYTLWMSSYYMQNVHNSYRLYTPMWADPRLQHLANRLRLHRRARSGPSPEGDPCLAKKSLSAG